MAISRDTVVLEVTMGAARDFFTAKKLLTALEKLRPEKMAELQKHYDAAEPLTQRVIGRCKTTKFTYRFEIIDLGRGLFLATKQTERTPSELDVEEFKRRFKRHLVTRDVLQTLGRVKEQHLDIVIFRDDAKLTRAVAAVKLSKKAAPLALVQPDIDKKLAIIDSQFSLLMQLFAWKQIQEAAAAQIKDTDVRQLRSDPEAEMFFSEFYDNEETIEFAELVSELRDSIPLRLADVFVEQVDVAATIYAARRGGTSVPPEFQRQAGLSLIGAGSKDDVIRKAKSIANGMAYAFESQAQLELEIRRRLKH